MPQRFLTALPVYNEVGHVEAVLAEVRRYSPEILVVDDGSSDGTAELLAAASDIHVVTHPQNRGYGAALRSAFDYAVQQGYDVLVTIDCDGQHEPQRIPEFVEAGDSADIVSGSRYLQALRRRFAAAGRPPRHQPANHRGAQPPPGPEPHRRLLRLQGLPRGDAAQAEPHGERLRHAAGAVGAGGACRLADHRAARAADLSGREAILRRRAGQRRQTAGALPPGHRAQPGRRAEHAGATPLRRSCAETWPDERRRSVVLFAAACERPASMAAR